MRQTLSIYKEAFKNRSLFVDILCILFGIGSWIGVNSLYLQLPLLVNSAPEGWSLPSYLVVIIQIGNIGPLAYTLLQKCIKKAKESFMIYLVLIIGSLASILTAFFYKSTTFINKQETSLSLFILVFFLSLSGCTSSVLFMPYMGRFKAIYLISYLIGEGLSGFLPSCLALIQGVGGNAECIPKNNNTSYEKYIAPPRFDTKDFFISTFIIMSCSTIAFSLLNQLKFCKKQYAAVKIKNGNNYQYEEQTDITTTTSKKMKNEILKKISSQQYKFLMFLMGLVCVFGNGVFPSIQSYSCLPYGNISYHLTTVLSSMANPVACFLAVFLSHNSIKTILILTGLSSIFTSYAILTAIYSPVPPLVGKIYGEIIIVSTWTLLVGLITYIKVSITAVMRAQGGKSLVCVGALQQIGSAIGSVIIFFLINSTNLFISYDPCST